MTTEQKASRPVPVTILSGFLGSGKTTLLNYILTERHGHRIAVIENEFGEINIDSGLVLTSEEEIFEMTNGCICCVGSVRTDLIRILGQLMSRREKFDHILVETSGLADPNPVAATFFIDDDIARQVNLDGIVTVVDAKHIGGHLDDPKLAGADNQAIDQIMAADRIIINKVDLVGEGDIRALEDRMRGLNTTASIFRSSYAKVDLDKILGIGAFDLSRTMASDEHFLDDHDHQHDPSLEFWCRSPSIRPSTRRGSGPISPASWSAEATTFSGSRASSRSRTSRAGWCYRACTACSRCGRLIRGRRRAPEQPSRLYWAQSRPRRARWPD